MATATVLPYALNSRDLAIGTYVITGSATDSKGGITTSALHGAVFRVKSTAITMI